MTSWTLSTNSGGAVYQYSNNPYGFTNLILSGNVITMDTTQPIVADPDHEWNPTERTGRFCQDCPPGSIWMDNPAKHLYVIREWEIG